MLASARSAGPRMIGLGGSCDHLPPPCGSGCNVYSVAICRKNPPLAEGATHNPPMLCGTTTRLEPPPAVERRASRARDQNIVSGSAQQEIAACPALQTIIARPAVELHR